MILVLRKIHRTKIISITNDSGKRSWISSPDCLVEQDKQLMQYPFIHKKNGRCSQIAQNSKIGMSRHLDRLPRHKWPKSWSSLEDPVVPLERNLYGHPLTRLSWERQFEGPIEAWLGENSKLGMSLCTS